MAWRGQYVGNADQGWKIDPEAFMTNFGEDCHPRATHLLYEIQWGRSFKTWKNFCTNEHPVHAEIIFLEDECEMIRQRSTTPCSMTWFLSWSPCGNCSREIIAFLEDHPYVTLEIRVARLYRHYDERNQEGLRNLVDSGVTITIMDLDDYSYCWRRFVAHQGNSEDFQEIFCEHLYWYYSEQLDWILQ